MRAGTAGRCPGSCRRRRSSSRTRPAGSTSLRSAICCALANASPHRRHTRRCAFVVGPLVVGDAEVARALEDVEQLAERQVHQPEDHGQRVDRVQCRVEAALEPHARHGQEQAGHRHGEQSGEGEEVAGAFHRHRARVAQPSAQEDEHAGEHQHRGDVEGVEDEPTDDALGVELQRADVRHVHLVVVGRAGRRSRSAAVPASAGSSRGRRGCNPRTPVDGRATVPATGAG